MNEYNGFHPNKSWTPERIEPITPAEFYSRFIQTRTPVILKSFPETLEFLELDILNSKLKDELVQVESIKNGSYGHSGTRSTMKFGEFLSQLDNKDLYLTTQYEEDRLDGLDDDGLSEDAFDGFEGLDDGSDEELDFDGNEPNDELDKNLEDYNNSLLRSFAAPPLNALLPDILPYKMDIFGNLVLHQINLWMGNSNNETSSGLHHDFHDNLYFLAKGVKKFTIYSPKDLNCMYLSGDVKTVHQNGYIEFKGTSGDNIRSDGAYKNDVLEWKVEILQDKLQSAKTDNERAEVALELEQTLDSLFNGNIDELVELDEEDLEQINGKRKPNTDQLGKKEAKLSDKLPNSFSKITANEKEFPKLSKATRIEFELNEGEVLYLPVGWFHEVRSKSSSSGNHMALNYWFAPPAPVGTFREPYEDNYWKSVRLQPVLEIIDSMRK
jgi:hypothetical protein